MNAWKPKFPNVSWTYKYCWINYFVYHKWHFLIHKKLIVSKMTLKSFCSTLDLVFTQCWISCRSPAGDPADVPGIGGRRCDRRTLRVRYSSIETLTLQKFNWRTYLGHAPENTTRSNRGRGGSYIGWLRWGGMIRKQRVVTVVILTQSKTFLGIAFPKSFSCFGTET